MGTIQRRPDGQNGALHQARQDFASTFEDIRLMQGADVWGQRNRRLREIFFEGFDLPKRRRVLSGKKTTLDLSDADSIRRRLKDGGNLGWKLATHDERDRMVERIHALSVVNEDSIQHLLETNGVRGKLLSYSGYGGFFTNLDPAVPVGDIDTFAVVEGNTFDFLHTSRARIPPKSRLNDAIGSGKLEGISIVVAGIDCLERGIPPDKQEADRLRGDFKSPAGVIDGNIITGGWRNVPLFGEDLLPYDGPPKNLLIQAAQLTYNASRRFFLFEDRMRKHGGDYMPRAKKGMSRMIDAAACLHLVDPKQTPLSEVRDFYELRGDVYHGRGGPFAPRIEKAYTQTADKILANWEKHAK